MVVIDGDEFIVGDGAQTMCGRREVRSSVKGTIVSCASVAKVRSGRAMIQFHTLDGLSSVHRRRGEGYCANSVV